MSFARYLIENGSPGGSDEEIYDLDAGISELLPSPRSDVSDLMLPESSASSFVACMDLEDEKLKNIEAETAVEELNVWFERRKRAHNARLKLAEYKLVLQVRRGFSKECLYQKIITHGDL
jgi:hypothetical protein